MNTVYFGPDPFILRSLFKWTRQYLAYTDDIVILTTHRNTDSLNGVLYQLQMKAKSAGLAINHNKTKFMRNIKNYNNNTNKVILNYVPYEEVSHFKHLGSPVTYNKDIMVEMQGRTSSGNRCLWALDNIMKARYISKKVKIKIYKTIIKPFVVYDTETSTLPKQPTIILATWERKIHSQIYGSICDRGIWYIGQMNNLTI